MFFDTIDTNKLGNYSIRLKRSEKQFNVDHLLVRHSWISAISISKKENVWWKKCKMHVSSCANITMNGYTSICPAIFKWETTAVISVCSS